MFGFFVSGEFKGFWSNSIGDVFCDLTCMKMQWSKESTTLVYYPSLNGAEIYNSVPTIDSVDVMQEVTNEIGVDENDQPIFETSQVLVRTIQSDKFMVNGLMLIPC